MKKDILSLFFPPACAFCGTLMEEGEHEICFACRKEVVLIEGEVCPYCNRDILACQCGKGKELDRLIAVFLYQGSVQRGIQRFKFQNCPEVAPILGKFLYEKSQVSYPGSFDFVVTVPMYPKKERKRGYNQANLLAEYLADQYRIPFADQALKKTKNHKPLHELTAKERQVQIKDTFSPGKDMTEMKESHVLLVDDVYTTGATLKECAHLLRKNGVGKVSGIVVAATEFHAIS